MHKAGKHWYRWLGVSLAVLLLDQLTKHVVTANFRYGESLVVTPFFNLVLAHNTGAAFSFLADQGGWQRGFFIVLSLAISAALLWMLRGHHGNRLLATALSMVIGGAIGNLVDRVRFGYVVDFVDWHAMGYHWPAFNIADSAICIGAALLVYDSFRKPAVRPGEVTE